jgi:hypothetical protein
MVTYIVVLSTQIHSTKMRSSRLIIKSNAQKQIVRFNFERKIHDLDYFELDFFHITLTYCTLDVIIKYYNRK